MAKRDLVSPEVVTEIGNGDLERGRKLLAHIASRLRYARGAHKWAFKSLTYGACAVMGEARELEKAVICDEGPKRVYDEALDTIVTAIRMANVEWEG